MSLYDLVISATVSISAFLGITLIIEQKHSPYPQFLLGAALLIISGFFAYIVLNSMGFLIQFPHLLRVWSPLTYLIGPLFFIYAKRVLYKDISLKFYDYIHFIPSFLHFFDLIPFYLLDVEAKRGLTLAILENINVLFREGGGFIPIGYHYGLRAILLLAYAVGILQLTYNRHAQNVQLATLKHIREVGFFFLALAILFNIMFVLGVGLFPSKLEGFSTLFVAILLSVMLLGGFGVLFFRGIGRSQMKAPDSINHKITNEEDEPNESKNDTPTLDPTVYTEDVLKILREKIDEFFQSDAYKNPELKIKDLAKALHISEREVNAVLMECHGQKFNQLLNKRRVTAAVALLDSDIASRSTLESLGERAGFPSRSTFFRVFKEETGRTPKQYRAGFDNI